MSGIVIVLLSLLAVCLLALGTVWIYRQVSQSFSVSNAGQNRPVLDWHEWPGRFGQEWCDDQGKIAQAVLEILGSLLDVCPTKIYPSDRIAVKLTNQQGAFDCDETYTLIEGAMEDLVLEHTNQHKVYEGQWTTVADILTSLRNDIGAKPALASKQVE